MNTLINENTIFLLVLLILLCIVCIYLQYMNRGLQETIKDLSHQVNKYARQLFKNNNVSVSKEYIAQLIAIHKYSILHDQQIQYDKNGKPYVLFADDSSINHYQLLFEAALESLNNDRNIITQANFML